MRFAKRGYVLKFASTPRLLQAGAILSRALHAPRGRGLLLPGRLWLCDMFPEPDTPASGHTRHSRIDQLDACILKRGNQLHQRIDVAADDAVTGFHALNRRNGKICQIGGLPLIDVQERASGPQLIGGNHDRHFFNLDEI
jgi:hypothetical protein